MIPLPPLDCLRFFEPAARQRSFVLAAGELGVTAPAVGHSPRPKASGHRIWNPFQLEEAKPIKRELLDASDRFPVSLDLY